MDTHAHGTPKHSSRFANRWTNHAIARRDQFINERIGCLPRDSLVINVGCGTVRRFESANSSRYLATDLRPLPNVDFAADLMALPVASSTAEVVVALEVIEHLPHPARALEEIRRVLKPGGMVIVSVPSTVPRHDHHDYWRFTAEGLDRLCSDVFGPGEVHVFGGTFETLGSIIEYYLALVFHVLRLPSRRPYRIFPSVGYWLDRHNRWSTSTTDLHTLAFDLLFVANLDGTASSRTGPLTSGRHGNGTIRSG